MTATIDLSQDAIYPVCQDCGHRLITKRRKAPWTRKHLQCECHCHYPSRS
jgi:DNA-directed RNA polymerase subunit RPC12/RpoP